MIDKMYEKLIDPQAMLAAMKETLRQIDPKYSEEEAAFLAGIEALIEGLPSDHPISLDAYLEEEERDMAECLLHLFWKGVKQNYDCFVIPVNKLFLRMDYEDFHQESLILGGGTNTSADSCSIRFQIAGYSSSMRIPLIPRLENSAS